MIKVSIKKIFKRITILIVFVIVFTLIFSKYISYSTKTEIYNDVKMIPKNKVGLLLGTIKYLSNNHINLYYQYRIEAAVKLYKAGKIDVILVSGDNSRKDYDEPSTFKNDLVNAGVPEDCIYLDYAGFSTLDSVIRAKEIFGQTELTIISQKFHNERAVYLAKQKDIKAVAFNAKAVSKRYGFKTNLREYLARTKAGLDILFNSSSRFLGNKIKIKNDCP